MGIIGCKWVNHIHFKGEWWSRPVHCAKIDVSIQSFSF